MTPGPFLYFIPGLAAASAQTLRDYGLDYLPTDRQAGPSVTSGPGPGGDNGVLFYLPGIGEHTPAPARFDNNRQKWASKKTSGPKALFVGFDREHPPTPVSLARSDLWNSHTIKTRKEWTVSAPIGIQITRGASALPYQSFIDPDGHRARRVSPEFARFGDYLTRLLFVFAGMEPGDGADVPPPLYSEEAEEIAADILSLNYRTGLEEWLLLEAFDDKIVVDILEAFIDLPTLKADALAALEKKTTEPPAPSDTPPADSASNNGNAASSPATPPPAPTLFGSQNPSKPLVSKTS